MCVLKLVFRSWKGLDRGWLVKRERTKEKLLTFRSFNTEEVQNSQSWKNQNTNLPTQQQKTLIRGWFGDGPASQTVGQRQNNNRTMYRVYLEPIASRHGHISLSLRQRFHSFILMLIHTTMVSYFRSITISLFFCCVSSFLCFTALSFSDTFWHRLFRRFSLRLLCMFSL